MTDLEENQAVDALKAWFISQDIDPPQAASVMSKLIAKLLVIKTKDLSELQDAVKEIRTLLICDIALELKL